MELMAESQRAITLLHWSIILILRVILILQVCVESMHVLFIWHELQSNEVPMPYDGCSYWISQNRYVVILLRIL